MASRGNCKKEGFMLSSPRAIVSTGTAPQSAARSWAVKCLRGSVGAAVVAKLRILA